MAFLHAQSCECLKSELLLFEIPPTQTTIESSHLVQYDSIPSLTDDAPIEFVIPGNPDEYLDLAYSMLGLRVSIKQYMSDKDLGEDRTTLKPNMGHVNNSMHSLFS